jgi:hypothetical protein
MRVIRKLLVLAGAAALAVAVVARFSDGPIGPFPGGALSGTVDPDPDPDWRSIGSTVEFEIRPDDPWSLRTYAIPYGREIYVPSFRAERRRWVSVVVADPRVRVRLGDRLYERRLERVADATTRARLVELMQQLHGWAPDGIAGDDTTWYFRLAPR